MQSSLAARHVKKCVCIGLRLHPRPPPTCLKLAVGFGKIVSQRVLGSA